MLPIILSACVLVAITMWMHAAGIAVLLRVLRKPHLLSPMRVWAITVMLLHMIWWLILPHLAEIGVRGLFYLWRGCLPHAEAAFCYYAPMRSPGEV